MLPYFNNIFKYEKIIESDVGKLLHRDNRTQIDEIVTNIDTQINDVGLDDEHRDEGLLASKIISKVQNLHDGTKADPEIEKLIYKVFGHGESDNEDERMIDVHNASFTDYYKVIIRELLLKSKPKHPVLKYLQSYLTDIESLLTDSFSGLYNNDISNIKKYIYQSWTLWAFLKYQEEKVLYKYNKNPIPFYSKLPDDWDMITLNYTSFAEKRPGNGKTHYFHGNLNNFIKMDNQQKCTIDTEKTIIGFIQDTVVDNTNFEKGIEPSFILPYIIAPLKVKPLISSEFIDIWHDSKNTLEDASRVIITGYSFNYADGHLNDLISRCYYKDKEFMIVDPVAKNLCTADPSAKKFLDSMKKIFSFELESSTENTFQGKWVCHEKKGGLKIVGAKAADIDWSEV
ncbi:MAG: hypothetical protein OXT69_08925 [Candidatus Poribacteria bacterium]|nr:hypothetical protein [Candidatus Poribacteria bacterium]